MKIMAKKPKLSSLRDITNISDNLKTVYSIVADSSPGSSVSIGQLTEIQDAMYQETLSGLDNFQTIDEAKSAIVKHVADGFYNAVTGIGTPADPGYYNQAFTPISMTPNEATAYYSSGGLARRITDIKANGIMANGYRWVSNNPVWHESNLKVLKEYSDSIAYDRAVLSGNRDGLLYGGSIVVPALKRDNPISYRMSVDELIANRILTKDAIDYLWGADRWNAIMVPYYNISASDYLHPKEMFIPITGLSVRTDARTGRASILRPKTLPYWGTLRQLGWGISDMEGWIFSVLAYDLCIRAIPIMAQQNSLLYRHIPLDGVIAQNGPDYAQELARQMSLQLVQWSNVAPKTFNSVGEIKAIERAFQGFESLVHLLQQDIGAQSNIADSILFNTQSTGFSDNKEDVTLKQAETIKQIGNEIIPQLQTLNRIVVISCFGPDSIEAKNADSVRVSFDSPIVLTNEERGAAAHTTSELVTSLMAGGASLGDALQFAQSFTPGIEYPQELMKRIQASAQYEDTEADTGDGKSSWFGIPAAVKHGIRGIFGQKTS